MSIFTRNNCKLKGKIDDRKHKIVDKEATLKSSHFEGQAYTQRRLTSKVPDAKRKNFPFFRQEES